MNAPILVLADDLTGAAEIAALGHERGLNTVIRLDAEAPLPEEADMIVTDTNSRLDPPEVAADKVRRALAALPGAERAHVYKKTDSVLRGAIAPELEAMSDALGRPAILLCPCNPTRGRVIARGRYSINGIPLHRTPFVNDPHHPAGTDEVVRLLRHASLPVRVQDSVVTAEHGHRFSEGFTIGCAETQADLARWARAAAPGAPANSTGKAEPKAGAGGVQTAELGPLCAGGADFFAAWLDALGVPLTPPTARAAAPVPAGPHLLLSGSLTPVCADFRRRLAGAGTTVVDLPIHTRDHAALALALQRLGAALARHGRAVAATSETLAPGIEADAWLQTCFSSAASELLGRGAFRHLLAEGGATAALAAATLGWDSFTVGHVWAGGVVSLRPLAAPDLAFTMKPGSYSWPEDIFALLKN